MKNEELLRKAGALALSAGISTVIGEMGVGLLAKFLADLTGKYLENLNLQKIKIAIQNTHPSKLNHHLQKALQQAVNQALTNVQTLYIDQLNYPYKKEETRKLINQLRPEVEAVFLLPSQTDFRVVELVDINEVNSVNKLSQLFETAITQLPPIDDQNPLPNFIRANFSSQLQLCFGEELKKPDQHEAWVAYQRLLLNRLKENAQETLDIGRETIQKLDELGNRQHVQFLPITKKQIAAIQELLNTLNKTEIRLEDRFQMALDSWVITLRSQMVEVITVSHDTNQKVRILGNQITQTDQAVKEFGQDLRRNWVSKYWLALGITVGVVLVCIVVISIYIYNRPIDMTVFVRPAKHIEISTDYPKFAGGELIFRFNNKEEKSIVPAHGEVIFKQIPASLIGTRVAVRLETQHWKSFEDTVSLNGPVLDLSIIPDGSLGMLTGNVRTITGYSLPTALVIINNDTAVYTNAQGIFRVYLPYRMQHDRYILKVEKASYQTYSSTYYPISGNIDIRLKKL